jgi:vacuolar iron transporter family protein
MGSRIERVQQAFYNRDVNASRRAHMRGWGGIDENHDKERGKYLKDYVYGALDGIVTTFAIVSGIEGAGMAAGVVLILGFANLFADGISMAFANYLSTKSDLEYIRREKERESWEIDNLPDAEKDEIRQIFKRKGFTGKDLDRAVAIITSDKKVWLETMMLEELGLNEYDKTPVSSGLATFGAFILAGLAPLTVFIAALFLPWLQDKAFFISMVLSALVLFGVGSLRTLVTGVNWVRSGTEMLVMGMLAASVAYGIGHILRAVIT